MQKLQNHMEPSPGLVAGSRRLPQKVSVPAHFLEEGEPERIQITFLLRKYLPLAVLLMLAGSLLATALGIFETPVYKASLLLEVQPISKDVLGQGMDPFSALYNLDATNLQTELLLLESGPFKGRVMKRMEGLPPLPPPVNPGLLFRLRKVLRPEKTNQAVSLEQAISMAADTFDAKIINETRLVALSCESPHPIITSEFLNNIANEFVEDSIRNRTDASEKTNAWLASHIADTKAKLQNADARLRAFVLRSGNIFASADGTADDVKLKQLQTELAQTQAARIAKQAQYESAVKSRAEALPELVTDPIAASIRAQLAELARQKSILLINLTPMNPKVKALDEQQQNLEAALKQEADNVTSRIKSEYESARQHERLLLEAYGQEGGEVTSQATKAAEYAALRREVDGLQKMYDSLLQELNRTQVSQSAPVTPVRLVAPSVPPAAPYKPQPKMEIAFGMIFGLASTIGIAFLREKGDRRLRSPEAVQILVRVPQLGVIPSVGKLPLFGRALPVFGSLSRTRRLGAAGEAALAGTEPGIVGREWQNSASLLADSFRATLASITRHLGNAGGEAKVIVVSSSAPSEGKTTVVSNLGVALSEAGKRVLVIDADFRRPSLSKIFGMSTSVTLPGILVDQRPIAEYSLEELTVASSHPGLYVLPCAGASGNIPTLIYSERLPVLLERFRGEFDLVIVDVPPILFPADARVIAQFVDGVVLVIRAGQSERENIRAAANCLHEDGISILGTVLNDWVPSGSKSGMHYYSYYSAQTRSDRS